MGAASRKMYRINSIPGVNVTTPYEIATFGGGCFWGMENLFRKHFGDKLRGTCVGYMGGRTQNPTYDEVCTGSTEHAEAVQVQFYPEKVSYDEIVEYFYTIHDPTTKNRQGNDIGTQYRSAIFCHTPTQLIRAREVTKQMQRKWDPKGITTELVMMPVDRFYIAEDVHQLYLEKNPQGYCNHFARKFSS